MTQKRKVGTFEMGTRAAKKRMTTEKRSINDLPVELLHYILSLVTRSDLKTLCQLPPFCAAAYTALYAYISTCNINIKKLFNTILRNHQLQLPVTGLDIGFPDCSDPAVRENAGIQNIKEWMWKIEGGSFENIAVILLVLLPQLRTVTIRSSYNASEFLPLSVPAWFRAVLPVLQSQDTLTFQTPFLSHVQSLNVTGFTAISLNNVAALFALPALTSLTLSRVQDSRQDFPSAAFRTGSSNISDLTFRSASLSTKCLCPIINGTGKLKRFVYTTAKHMDNLAIISALLKDRTSLEILELPRLSRSPIIPSIVQFSKLEKLSINAGAVFGDHLRAPTFPPNLRTIELTDVEPLISSQSNMDCMRELLLDTKPLPLTTAAVHYDSMNYEPSDKESDSESDSEGDSVRFFIHGCWTEEEDNNTSLKDADDSDSDDSEAEDD
ncbi:hypothetical protein DM02DRAFT_729580 [Periconia macrospinosa]|uniref:F-box domain-containing protein n=1 Tax=Periconia macrospinosa TaxID=97972 RepID=A0A2V1DL49_9PLEO|nr:hypothetical protein DM02DRAFT_729580 [Periconia macrospinosa]